MNGRALIFHAEAWKIGRKSCRGYDATKRLAVFNCETPPHGIEPLVRVGERARPIPRLVAAGEIREAGVVIIREAGQASPLDTGQIANGRYMGTIRMRDSRGRDVAWDVMFAFAFHAFFPKETGRFSSDLNLKCVDIWLRERNVVIFQLVGVGLQIFCQAALGQVRDWVQSA